MEIPALLPDAGGGSEPPAACEPGVACCAARPCPEGSLCVDGACQSPPSEPSDAGACQGSDCPNAAPVPLAPTCDDGVQNGDETGSDCGGSCPLGCAVGLGCNTDADCIAGLTCSAESARCSEPSCLDGILNGAELLEDCGGGTCAGCPDGSPCNAGTDCASGFCAADASCAQPTCDDEFQNGDETGVDCGGSCAAACPDGAGCVVAGDCQSSVCGPAPCDDGVALCCQAPACDDEIRNGGEADVDCGAPGCQGCPVGASCEVDAQCESGECTADECREPPACDDEILNGNESDVDCGGTCPVCPDLAACNLDTDCFNSNCDERGICISCGDAVLNGTESDVDCGGGDPFCQRCVAGQRCVINTDCASQFCFGGFC